MTSYSKTFRNTTRETFARDACFEAFGHRAGWALDHDDFVDRRPHIPPRRSPESRFI